MSLCLYVFKNINKKICFYVFKTSLGKHVFVSNNVMVSK